MQSVRIDTASFLLNKRFEKLQGHLEDFWVVFQKNVDNAVSHNRIKNKLGFKIHEKNLEGADAKEIEKIERLLAKHDKFDAKLKKEYDECKDVIQHGIPMLVDQKGEIKDKDKWIVKCQSLLSVALDVAQIDGIELKETTAQMD